MCVAIPARVTGIAPDGRQATADIGGVARMIDLAMTSDVEVGDWVITHSGFAVRRIDDAEAQEIHELLASLRPEARG